MSRIEILSQLQKVFAEVFDDDDIVITEETVADDVDGWDSLNHITLIAEVEDNFDMKFAMKDVIGMKNIGDMVDILELEE